MIDIARSLANLMKEVEEGLTSESVKSRIKELEIEKKHIKSKLFEITANYPEMTKPEVVAWLTGLKAGDINDKKFQSELFNTFISAVYLYDDKRVKIVFGMPDGGKYTYKDLPDDLDDQGGDVRMMQRMVNRTGIERTPTHFNNKAKSPQILLQSQFARIYKKVDNLIIFQHFIRTKNQ